ncbi:MAG TPA: transglycosylase domain-containing protein, partial [Vicinamibacterales bacterium]|nr:transglycosylase domain-containing protein [Vicinamibacterales bacterium]
MKRIPARVRATGAAARQAWRSVRGPRDWIALALVAALIVGGAVTTAWLTRYGLAVDRLTRGVGDLVFYDGTGRAWFRMNEQRKDVPLARISSHLQHAVIAVEDRRFRYHPGIDPIGLVRATVRNVREPGTVEGGSTITQQLARTLFLSNAKTYARKLKEAMLALLLEVRLSKDDILELYLNRVYLSAGVYGVEAMSNNLFGKHASELTAAEAALVAGLVQAPSALSPWSNYEGALRRRDTVLGRMYEAGYLTDAELRAARRQRPRIRPHPGAQDARAGYAKEYLRQQFRARFGGDQPPDWQVHTTILPAVQDAAEKAVADGLRRLGRRDLQVALVVLDPHTGNVLAIVGGRDFRESSFNRAWRSRRQPGSAFKPFVYAAALTRGRSPVSVISGLETIAPQGTEEWAPRNARGEAVAELTIRQALIESNN